MRFHEAEMSLVIDIPGGEIRSLPLDLRQWERLDFLTPSTSENGVIRYYEMFLSGGVEGLLTLRTTRAWDLRKWMVRIILMG